MKTPRYVLSLLLLAAGSAWAGDHKSLPSEADIPLCSLAMRPGTICRWQMPSIAYPDCYPGIEAGTPCKWPASAITFPLTETVGDMIYTQPRQNVAVLMGNPYKPDDAALPLRSYSLVLDVYRGQQPEPPRLHLTGGISWWAPQP